MSDPVRLDDAALRERAMEFYRCDSWHYEHNPVERGKVDKLTTDYIALRDAARVEQRDTIKALMIACDELMTEFVSKKRAANWGVINDAMVAGGTALHAGSKP